VQASRVNALVGRQVKNEFATRLAELAARARRITALAVIEADGYMDDGLKEYPPWSTLPGPSFFKYFMACKKLAIVEEPYPFAQELIHVLGVTVARAAYSK